MFQAVLSNSTAPRPALTKYHRPEIEAMIEALVALLDAFDGDPDIEDDDPAGTDLDDGEQDGLSDLMPMPVWGLDQSLGPVNVEAAGDAYHAAKLASGEEWYVL